MGTPTAKSFVETREATDAMIYKRALKKMYGITSEQMSIFWPTIQNTSYAILPDGTMAQTNDDIRLVQGIPLRTSTGVVEYKEDTPTENFPLRIELETIAYNRTSFENAVETQFEIYTEANTKTASPVPTINVREPFQTPPPRVEVIRIDNTVASTERVKTATEEYGKDVQLLTQINSAGDLTGIEGLIYLVWKGFKYYFAGGNTEVTKVLPLMAPQVFPPYQQNKQIAGLTNTFIGRNLEVFLKDRNLKYSDIKIVPSADITKIPDNPYPDGKLKITWGTASTDGYQYNTNDVTINKLKYQPGDLIKGVSRTAKEKPIFLPDQSARWTEFHPYDTQKPEHRAQVYKPTPYEIAGKAYEGKLIRGYVDGNTNGKYTDLKSISLTGPTKKGSIPKLKDFFMIIKGQWRNLQPFDHVTAHQGNPPGWSPDKTNTDGTRKWNFSNITDSQVMGYHGNSYTIMSWDQLMHIGTGLTRQTLSRDSLNTLIQFNVPVPITTAIPKFTAIANKQEWNGNFSTSPESRRKRFPGGDSKQPASYPYAGAYAGTKLYKGWRSTSTVASTTANPAVPTTMTHYFNNGRFEWPYDKSGQINITANILIGNSSSSYRGMGAYIQIRTKDYNPVKKTGKKTNISGKLGEKRIYKNGADFNIDLKNININKGESVHVVLKQNSSKEKLWVYGIGMQITVKVLNALGTKEGEKAVADKFGKIGEKGGMQASGTLSSASYLSYIKEGDFYNKPHLEKYNELFSSKVSKSIKK